MIKKILFLLVLVPVLLFGQKTKKIIDKEKNETFYVLKSDKTTKHGEYNKFWNNKLLVKGYYKLSQKDSIWESFDLNGQLSIKYDFTKNQLIYYKPGKNIGNMKFKFINGNQNSDSILNRIPIFLGGEGSYLIEINNNIRYPVSAQENGISGIVNVFFIVDKFGKTSNYNVKTPLGYGLDEEAIRVLKLLSDNWLAGLFNGQPADVEVMCPITFRLQ